MLREYSIYDLEFEKIPYIAHSSRGTPYTKYRSVGMPRVPDGYLNSVFYLYRTKEAAENGSQFGGTGSFIAVKSEKFPDEALIYGVTNWHVAVRDGFSVIRIKTADGGNDILEFDPSDWTFIQDGNDVAISPILPLRHGFHDITLNPTDIFVTRENLPDLDLGIGDDIFMLGKFIEHDGGPTNRPAARFGNISIMPSDIRFKNMTRESYCIDMHSRSGYSGSPVFVYRTPGANLRIPMLGHQTQAPIAFIMLLGIHWGQFEEGLEIADAPAKSEASNIEIIDGKYVKGSSGMTMVCPSWSILDVLNLEKFKREKIEWEEKLSARKAVHSPSIMEESSTMPSGNDEHREDFNNLLDAAVRGKPSGG